MVIKTSSHMISLYFPCKFRHGESWIEKLGLCILINLISILKKTYRILTSLISILYWYRILTKRVQSKANHLFHHLLTQINGTIIEPKIDSFKLSGLISFSNYYFSISWLSNCESLSFLDNLPTLCCKRYFFLVEFSQVVLVLFTDNLGAKSEVVWRAIVRTAFSSEQNLFLWILIDSK